MPAYELNNYSYEDYLQIDKTTPSSERHELIFGHIFAMSGASAPHQDVVGDIFFKLKQLHQETKCFPRIAPFDLKIECDGYINVVQPDIILYCEDKEIPCAVFEVLSPSTAYKDRGSKKELYELCGILNYFIVDPLGKTIDKFVLKNEKYLYDRCYGADSQMEIECLDESVDVREMLGLNEAEYQKFLEDNGSLI